MKRAQEGNRLRQFTEFFTANLGLKVLSLAIAVLLYFLLAPTTADREGGDARPIILPQQLLHDLTPKPVTVPAPSTTNSTTHVDT